MINARLTFARLLLELRRRAGGNALHPQRMAEVLTGLRELAGREDSPESEDRNGRTLGRVWCAGTDANAEQVRRGMAWVFDRYVKDRGLYAVQEGARRARLGLWRDAAPVPPWEWRRAKGAAEYRPPK